MCVWYFCVSHYNIDIDFTSKTYNNIVRYTQVYNQWLHSRRPLPTLSIATAAVSDSCRNLLYFLPQSKDKTEFCRDFQDEMTCGELEANTYYSQ